MFNNKPSQPAFTELHLAIETLEQSVKYIPSYRYFVIFNVEVVSHFVLLFLLLIFPTIFFERDQTHTLKQVYRESSKNISAGMRSFRITGHFV